MTIRFVTRQDLIARHDVLAAYMRAWQAAMYDPEPQLVAAGDRAWLGDDADGPVVLTGEQADAMNGETIAYFMALCDDFQDEAPHIDYSGRLVAETDASSFENFTDRIGGLFSAYAKRAGWNRIFLITEARRPLLARDLDHPPAAITALALIELGFTREFDGGIVCDADDMSRLLPHFFQIARADGSAPAMLMTAQGSRAVASPCKYGNLHFETHDPAQRDTIAAALEQSGFLLAPDGECVERFSRGNAIEGRSIRL